MSRDTEQVVEIERTAWLRANDPKFYEQALVDGAVSVIEPMGFIEKAQAVEFSKKGKPFKDVEMKDLVVRQITPDCIVLAYHGEGRHVGEDKPYQGSVASVYVNKGGRWQMALTAHQPWKPDGGARS